MKSTAVLLLLTFAACVLQAQTLTLSRADYTDRCQAIWAGQVIAVYVGFPFEHKTASVKPVYQFPKKYTHAIVDDDWYYEMVAIRAFEKYGPELSVEQLGRQWLENNCGTWGSSEQARLLLAKGVAAPDCGHPRYNRLWFSIGPQFSADVYGALAPGQPNTAAALASRLARINGYAEGVDGAVFVAAAVSLGFSETDPKQIVRKAAKTIHPESPYRQCLDLVIALGDKGCTPQEVFNAVEDRWHIEYPATNNAVANGGLTAAALWFGEGDFWKTMNLACSAADFTDADCNAANAAAVIGAMNGMKGLPAELVAALNDRILGADLGGLKTTPAVDETLSDLARRTVAVGEKILERNGAKRSDSTLEIPQQQPAALPLERFRLADLMQYWNKDWTLERAGFGGAGGGMGGIRGITYLDGEVLATYPRDEVRGLVLWREMKLEGAKTLAFSVGADAGRAWELEVFVDNRLFEKHLIEGTEKGRTWTDIRSDLSEFAGRTVRLRLYQRVLVPKKTAGNAYWRNLRVE